MLQHKISNTPFMEHTCHTNLEGSSLSLFKYSTEIHHLTEKQNMAPNTF